MPDQARAVLSRSLEEGNRIVAVATGNRLPDGPVYHVFEVL